MMRIIGVTGGIGSGKTTFCRELERLGASVYYADEKAKVLMVQDRQLMDDLRLAFGDETYHTDGSLNKSHLIREAFERDRVEELNRLVHPAVRRDFEKFCETASKRESPMVVKEAALMLNYGRPESIPVIVLILADKTERLNRVKERNKVSYSEVEARAAKQPDFESLTELADHIIYNNRSQEELKRQARQFFEEAISGVI